MLMSGGVKSSMYKPKTKLIKTEINGESVIQKNEIREIIVVVNSH